jgi:hypothetical protein
MALTVGTFYKGKLPCHSALCKTNPISLILIGRLSIIYYRVSLTQAKYLTASDCNMKTIHKIVAVHP